MTDTASTASPETLPAESEDMIRLVGARVHNLRNVDAAIPIGKRTVLTGVSGSGKSSLAFDTLHAEGQRRYIESFSASIRQFLPRLDKPTVDRIDNLPPSVAVAQHAAPRNRQSLLEAAGLADYLKLYFARASHIVCFRCGSPVRAATPESIADELAALAAGTTVDITFPADPEIPRKELRTLLQEEGFSRVFVGDELHRLDQPIPDRDQPLRVSIDRVRWASADEWEERLSRMVDSLETAYLRGEGTLDLRYGEQWHRRTSALVCPTCSEVYQPADPPLFDWTRPENACPTCQGEGEIPVIDPDRVIPNRKRTLRQKGIALIAGKDEPQLVERFLRTAADAGLSIDLPFDQMSAADYDKLWKGDASHAFPGIEGLLAEVAGGALGKKKSSIERYKSPRRCSDCEGKRLAPSRLAYRIGQASFGDLFTSSVDQVSAWCHQLPLAAGLESLTRSILTRLDYLQAVGLGYLTFDRQAATLSTGETRRVALSAALGSSLAHTLFVLDEPTAGLHPQDTQQLLVAIDRLTEEQNTVVVVEHDPDVIKSAEWLVELGPGAGENGGTIVYEGEPAGLADCEDSATAGYIWYEVDPPRDKPLKTTKGIEVQGARLHNLKDITVRFPLGGMCVVAGVSGSGKSSLVLDTLYPAMLRALGDETVAAGPHDLMFGAETIDEVILIDAESIGRTSRGNLATYLKIFDEVRSLFAETVEARSRGLTAGSFSFNVVDGRCERCEGTGELEIDMQFLPPVRMVCPECQGARFQNRVLEVKFRGRSIAEVLDLSIREAIGFFRNLPKIQVKLELLLQVGLDYARLGQSLDQLSGGERQRLKLASCLAPGQGKRRLIIAEEPTTGLHPADIEVLLECFASMVAAGHSLIVVEHNLQFLSAADWVIELGPGAGAAGGEVLGEGTPAEIAKMATPTGDSLRAWLEG